MSTANHTVRNRIVFTYSPQDWPVGLITGYDNGRACFVLEHVVSFDSNYLKRLLKSGLAEAVKQGFGAVILGIPHEHPRGKPLRVVAEQLGFHEHNSDSFQTYFFRLVP